MRELLSIERCGSSRPHAATRARGPLRQSVSYQAAAEAGKQRQRDRMAAGSVKICVTVVPPDPARGVQHAPC